MSRDYRIGQILYIISRTSRAVFPVQVIEVNHKKTMSGGESVTFLVQDHKKRGEINLDEIAGDIYTNPNEVMRYLKDSADKAIDEMMSNVLDTASKAFQAKEDEEEEEPYSSLPVKKVEIQAKPTSDDEIEISTVNGQPQKARIRSIKMPEGLSQ